jgi:hypothetical protein
MQQKWLMPAAIVVDGVPENYLAVTTGPCVAAALARRSHQPYDKEPIRILF